MEIKFEIADKETSLEFFNEEFIIGVGNGEEPIAEDEFTDEFNQHFDELCEGVFVLSDLGKTQLKNEQNIIEFCESQGMIYEP